MTDGTVYCVWVSRALGAGHFIASEAVRQSGSAEAFYHAVQQKNGFYLRLTEQQRGRVKALSLESAYEVVNDCDKKGIDILTIDNVSYPERLRSIYAPPVVLYMKGRSIDFIRHVSIGMVGSRRMTDYGAKASYRISRELAASGAVVVSGLALGIDACAHRGALDAGGLTAAVLGCGLDVVYPPENEALMKEIETKGLLISEYTPGVPPLSRHFPARNRILAGLCDGVCVVEAPQKSGALITASLALEQGRDIFAVPGSIFSSASEGPLRLLREGAIPVGGANDILLEYEGVRRDKLMAQGRTDWYDAAVYNPAASQEQPGDARQMPAMLAPTLPDRLSRQAVVIYAALSTGKKHLDQLAAEAGLSSAAAMSALTELELEELARAHPGGCYSLLGEQ